MSTRQRQGRWSRRVSAGKHSLSAGLGGVERPPYGARQVAFQAAQRLALGLALGAFAGEEGARRLMGAHLRDRDAVQGGVQLAVAATVQAVAIGAAARDRHGGDAGVHGEARLAGEAQGACGLANEAGGGETTAAGQGEQLGGELGGELRDLALQGVDLHREAAAAACEVEGDAHLHPGRQGGERLLEAGQPAGAAQGLGRHLERHAEVVQVPAQAALDARALGDQVGAVVGEQAQLALGAGEARLRQVRLAQGGAGDRGGVDGVALAAGPRTGTGLGHQLRWHAHAGLATRDEEALEAAGEVAAVLEREAALGRERARPAEQARLAGVRGLHRELAKKLAGGGLEGHRGVALLVRVDPEYDHSCPLSVRIPCRTCGTAGGQVLVGASSQAPIRSRRRTSRPAAGGTTHEGQPRRVTSSLRATPPPYRRLPDQRPGTPARLQPDTKSSLSVGCRRSQDDAPADHDHGLALLSRAAARAVLDRCFVLPAP